MLRGKNRHLTVLPEALLFWQKKHKKYPYPIPNILGNEKKTEKGSEKVLDRVLGSVLRLGF